MLKPSTIKRFIYVLRRTNMIQMVVSYGVLLAAAGFVLFIWEPSIKSYGDGVWYSFVAATTIGFGDICVTTVLGRIVTVVIAIYGIMTAAMIPGVVVTYYTEYQKARHDETVSTFLEKLEHLPELSKEELEDLSERVKKFNRKK